MSSKQRQLSKRERFFLGMMLMLFHAASLPAVHVVVKKMGKVISGEQIAFLYKFGVLLCSIPLLFQGVGGFQKNIRTERIKLHFMRSLFSLLGTICYYKGLLNIPLADATAITFLEPIIAMFAAVLYLRERISIQKVLFVIPCFIGAVFIIQPDFEGFNKSYIYLFGALVFWAMNNLSIKVLGKTEGTNTSLFYVSLFGTIFALPLAMFEKSSLGFQLRSWEGFQIEQMKYFGIMTIFHIIHMICFFRALKVTEMSSVMPFDYTRLFFAGILGYVFLNEHPEVTSMYGYLLIAIGGVGLIYYEASRQNNESKK